MNGDRLWSDIEALARITDPTSPYTRRAFTDVFLEGRAWLRRRFEEAGLETRIDAAGNLIGYRAGSQSGAGSLVIGSHSDTVPCGGRFDGIAGVLAGLEVLRCLPEGMRHPVEVVDFLAEEPNVYGSSCVGSRGMSGHLGPEMLSYRNNDGETLAQGIARMGGDPGRIGEAARSDIAAYLELHIEQGPVLERTGTDLGIVTDIVGIVRYELVFHGQADHAGTTPMDIRKDALVAAAMTIASIRKAAGDLSSGADYFVATVGVVAVEPNAANVVPSRATIVVEARSTSDEKLDGFAHWLDEESSRMAEEAGVSRAAFTQKSRSDIARCDPYLRSSLRRSAVERNRSAIDLASGAGHDAMFISTIAPMAMVFVPCLEGRSHCPEEFADKASLINGAQVLLDTMMELDASPPG